MGLDSVLPKQLLEILVCPATHQTVHLADDNALEMINRQITEGKLKNQEGKLISETLDGALVRDDKQVAYPIRGGIPIMLIEESFSLT